MIGRKTILQLAKEAGDKGKVPNVPDISGDFHMSIEELERFAHLIAAEQKERDARICDGLAKKWKPDAERCYTQDDLCASACAVTILSILAVMEQMGKAVRGAYMKDLHDDALLTELADALAAYNKLLNGE